MAILDGVRSWWENLPANRAEVCYSARCDVDGVIQTASSVKGAIELRLGWEQITLVCCYKRDCLFVDQIQVVLWSEELGLGMEVTEEDAGYEELIDELPSRLPGCLGRDEWFERVAFPAFAENLTVLYRRAGTATQADIQPSAEDAGAKAR